MQPAILPSRFTALFSEARVSLLVGRIIGWREGLGMNRPSCFGELGLTNNVVREFSDKQGSSWINGGYFFVRSAAHELTSPTERSRAGEIALTDARIDGLRVWPHAGFSACMDTQRDKDQLEELLTSG